MDNFDEKVTHAMNLAVLTGIIKALSKSGILSPWTISEELSLINKEHLSKTEVEGLELAQEWVWREFTENSPPH
jgi:hypothetical protein